MQHSRNHLCYRRLGIPLGAALALTATAGSAEAGKAMVAGVGPLKSDQRLVPAVHLPRRGGPIMTLSSEMRRLHVPAVSIAVVRNGSVAWAKAYGQTRVGGAAATTNTRFQAASISKTVTAIAVLRLVEAGRLSLDEDVNQYLKQWKLPEPSGERVTLRALLSHTGGVNVGGFPGYPAGTPAPSVTQVLDGTPPAATPPVRVDSAPGSSWRYSGGGYTIVQQLLVDVTGKQFPDLMQELVLRPAGMRDSAFSQPLPAGDLERAALPYSANGAAIEGGPHIYPELAAAGMWTTPTDLALFLIELQRCAEGKGQLLTQAMAKEAFTPGLGDWGLGFQIEGDGPSRRFGHLGANAGYRLQFAGYLTHPDGAVIMTNGDNGKVLSEEILRTLAAQYHWGGYEPRIPKSAPEPEDHFHYLAGAYALSGKGNFIISDRNGNIFVKVDEQPEKLLYNVTPGSFIDIHNSIEITWNTSDGSAGTISLEGAKFQFARREP